jgi:protein CpxP
MKASMAVRLGLAIASLLPFGVASAQGPAGGPGFGAHRPPFERALGPQGNGGRWWNNPMVIEKLKLTEAQRKSMDEILLQHRETLIDLRAAVQKAELALEPLMRDDQPNEGRILAQIDKVAQSRAELEKANARFLLAIRGKLTPEQWTAVQALRAERQQHGWEKERKGPDGQGRRRMGPPQGQPGMGPQGRNEEVPSPLGPEAPGAEQ